MTENTENKNEHLLGLGPGVIVRLRSGGPYMAVKEVAGGNARCTWFKEGIVMEHVFDKNQLDSQPSADIVRLRSGGPYMVILEFQGPEKAKCMWFDKAGIVCERVFPVPTLAFGFHTEDFNGY